MRLYENVNEFYRTSKKSSRLTNFAIFSIFFFTVLGVLTVFWQPWISYCITSYDMFLH